MKLLFTTGGGGHFAPLLALLQILPKDVTYRIVGRKYAFEGDATIAFEYTLAKERNLPYYPLTTGRLQRVFTRHTIPSLLKIPYGLYQAIKIVKGYKPDVVVSFGGYVTVPVVLAAWVLRIPIIIHEQTPQSGLANRFAARFATKVCISWESSRLYFPQEKTVFTGNPMLKTTVTKHMKTLVPKGHEPLLCILGGSLGSHAINLIVGQSLEQLLQTYRIFHQTGDSHVHADHAVLKQKRIELPKVLADRYVIEKFIDPIELLSIIQKSDLVISRAGINTILQLLTFEKPSFLLPLKQGQKGEQLFNAMLLKNAGLAEVATEREQTPDTFVRAIQSMMKRRSDYVLRDSSFRQVVADDAARKLFEVITHVEKK